MEKQRIEYLERKIRELKETLKAKRILNLVTGNKNKGKLCHRARKFEVYKNTVGNIRARLRDYEDELAENIKYHFNPETAERRSIDKLRAESEGKIRSIKMSKENTKDTRLRITTHILPLDRAYLRENHIKLYRVIEEAIRQLREQDGNK